MQTIIGIPGEDLKPGDLLYINRPKRNRIQRFVYWLLFWRTEKVYKVVSVETSSTFVVASESDEILVPKDISDKLLKEYQRNKN